MLPLPYAIVLQQDLGASARADSPWRAVRVTEKDPASGCRRGQVMRGRPMSGPQQKRVHSISPRRRKGGDARLYGLMLSPPLCPATVRRRP
jgi:hypothetical protein